MGRTRRCERPGCGNRTTASSGICQGCKSKRHHARKRIEREGLLLDTAGGSWWVWDAKGLVLVIGRDTKREAFDALAFELDAEFEVGPHVGASSSFSLADDGAS